MHVAMTKAAIATGQCQLQLCVQWGGATVCARAAVYWATVCCAMARSWRCLAQLLGCELSCKLRAVQSSK
jgi:hypothetical protein